LRGHGLCNRIGNSTPTPKKKQVASNPASRISRNRAR
jgi:hypothetical protein